MMKTFAAVLVFGMGLSVLGSAAAQNTQQSPKEDTAAAARSAAGCGPASVDFDVKTDPKQHPAPRPDQGRALVYFLQVETQDGGTIRKGWVTTRAGIDGNWAGANHGRSYFFVPVEPGEHAACADWQSRIKTYSSQNAALNFTAEAGKAYYIRATILEITAHQNTPGMKLELIDDAEGQLLISSSALSTAHPKK